MPVGINGIDQMPPEEKEMLSKIQSESKKGYRLAVVSLILAILSIVISVLFSFVKF